MHLHHFSHLAGELSYLFFTSAIGDKCCIEDKVSSTPNTLKTLNKRSKLALALAGLDQAGRRPAVLLQIAEKPLSVPGHFLCESQSTLDVTD